MKISVIQFPILLRTFSEDQIMNESSFVQIMDWWHIGDKPFAQSLLELLFAFGLIEEKLLLSSA